MKPKIANAATDIHIGSDHGIDYTLQFREVSGDADDHFDSKVFLSPVDKGAKEKLTELPVFVLAADLERAKQETAAAKAAPAAELKAEDAKAEQYRSQYPDSFHFDYTRDERRGMSSGCNRFGGMTSSLTYADISKNRLPFTRPKTGMAPYQLRLQQRPLHSPEAVRQPTTRHVPRSPLPRLRRERCSKMSSRHIDGWLRGPVMLNLATDLFSYDHQQLLLPQDTRILGTVQSVGSEQQRKLFVTFHCAICPDGFSLELGKYLALDQIGTTGLATNVNHGYLQAFAAAAAVGGVGRDRTDRQ